MLQLPKHHSDKTIIIPFFFNVVENSKILFHMNGLFKFWFFSSHDPNSLLLLKVVIENIYPRKERAYQNGTWVPPNHNSTSFLLSSICSVRHFPSLLNIAVWEHHCNSSIVLVNGKIKHSVIIVCSNVKEYFFLTSWPKKLAERKLFLLETEEVELPSFHV